MMGPVSALNRVHGYASKYLDDVRGWGMSGKQLGRSDLESVFRSHMEFYSLLPSSFYELLFD